MKKGSRAVGEIETTGAESFTWASPVQNRAEFAELRQRLLELGEFCFQQRPILRRHLAEACLRGLKHNQFDVAVIDGVDRSHATRGMLLAAGLALSRSVKKLCSRKRVGIVYDGPLPSRERIAEADIKLRLGSLPLISTFHSLCVRILRRDIEKLKKGYTHSFTIYDQDESLRVIKACIMEAFA